VSVCGWPSSGWQADENFPEVLSPIGALGMGLQLADVAKRDKSFTADSLPYIKNLPISRIRSLGDGIMTAIVLAPFSLDAIQFTDLGRLRVQECERVAALRTELTRCGARVLEEGDTLRVYPSELHGAEIETYNDHRMAMCFAVLGLKIPGIKIRNPACVKKTFPNFFQKLAAPPPDGLGARILDAATSRQLTLEELFAE
jgi:3-phosphoshikimate 1-carboxyvinyltransferase